MFTRTPQLVLRRCQVFKRSPPKQRSRRFATTQILTFRQVWISVAKFVTVYAVQCKCLHLKKSLEHTRAILLAQTSFCRDKFENSRGKAKDKTDLSDSVLYDCYLCTVQWWARRVKNPDRGNGKLLSGAIQPQPHSSESINFQHKTDNGHQCVALLEEWSNDAYLHTIDHMAFKRYLDTIDHMAFKSFENLFFS